MLFNNYNYTKTAVINCYNRKEHNVVECRDLGLAAYVKMSGVKLLSCEGRVYKFDCEQEDFRELEIKYANSPEREHDSNVMFLRTLQR